MKTYQTLADLLDGETPHHFGRSLYKYTDCGPWIAYVALDAPARETAEIRVMPRDPQRRLWVQGCSRDAARFCGFDDVRCPARWRSLAAYLRRVRHFVKHHQSQQDEWRVIAVRPCVGCVRLDLERSLAARTRSVNYADADVDRLDPATVVGVEIGSIVEGSDVEIDPEYLAFPFTDRDFDAAVQRINNEASFYWERDNTGWPL